ncbi:MAG TPA: DUF262 domain-containing protein [Thiopseudomonas sp.]|nr:DUF262 domain-containing protein [Thiopseudomonas sp.]
MSKLSVDQKSIEELLSDKRVEFLIPDYQRPYAWDEEQCLTLWDDIVEFAFPDNNTDNFDNDNEYFLGAIVTFKNDRVSEVIDGQQRLTTLMLLLRAFYDKFEMMKDQNALSLRGRIEKCIWTMDEFGNLDMESLKISSEVATDNDKEEFIEILRTGAVTEKNKSRYADNFTFFKKKIESFINEYPSYTASLAARILNNCILLPIEAESQDTALRIFSTLNDRGLPLSDADIFKAQFYKHYGSLGKKDWFIDNWKELEEVTSRIFQPISGTPMDELFTRYMYYLRAKEGIKTSTTEALRRFYERNKYQYFQSDRAIEDLKKVAFFWVSIYQQNKDVFSEAILKKLFVLTYAPNGMWQHMTTAYFLTNKDCEDKLEETAFSGFLDKITAFIFAYAITNPGVNALRAPAYDEMVNIVNGKEITFQKYKFDEIKARSFFENYKFTNQRTVTRSLVTWYAFSFNNQKLLNLDDYFQIEHIYSKKRQEMDQGLKSDQNLELLGNKILLEQAINIRASDYRFEDKLKIYQGIQRRGSYKAPSQIAEIECLAAKKSFNESDIVERNQEILDRFFEFLGREELLIESKP